MISQRELRPPRHVVVLAHPDRRSFNAAMAAAYCEAVRACGQDAVLRDLYAMRFDPVLHADERPDRPGFTRHADVDRELALIAGADVLALVYPIWFGTAPAMLKGYIDRVLGSGVTPAALQARAGGGPLAGCRLISLTSSAARAPWLAEVGQEAGLRDVFDRYLEHGFGMGRSGHIHFGGIVEGLSNRFVDEHLYELREHVRALCAKVATDARGRAQPADLRAVATADPA